MTFICSCVIVNSYHIVEDCVENGLKGTLRYNNERCEIMKKKKMEVISFNLVQCFKTTDPN